MNPQQSKARNFWRTAVVVLLAAILAWALWWYYLYSPWTRDGRVRVEVVDIAAQIDGQVVKVLVQDNQVVHKGDPLFVVDPEDYRLALQQADASVESRRLSMQIAQENALRRMKVQALAISAEEVQTATNAYEIAAAQYKEAVAARNTAQLNMTRTTIYSPVNGYIVNLHLRVGDYAMRGERKVSVVDTDSFWVAGYFEETRLPRIHEGARARIKLMGVGPEVEGHVESYARVIADPNGGVGSSVADVDPVFTWVRLAQRIPVRIAIDHVPDGVKIVAGQTCTIVIEPK
jgi:RND family efflux transporter MFP subunit